MKISEALELAKDLLTSSKIPSPGADAHWLLAYAIGDSRAEVVRRATLDLSLSDSELELFKESLQRRAKREPLQHITGRAAFRSIELSVGPGVFIPRFETEQVTQIAIDYLRLLPNAATVIDVGTGSGAIALSIAKETGAKVVAIELSEEAAEYAKRNIDEWHQDVQLVIGPFEEILPNFSNVDLIISNPPYIPLTAIPLEPEVWKYDPELALYSGEDGLDAIRELADLSYLSLREGGMLVLEHADGQSDEVCELLLSSGFTGVTAHPDPTGRLRAVSAIRRA